MSWRPNTRVFLLLASVLLVCFFFPVRTPVSGHTRLRFLRENDTPLSGVHVRQTWGIYGYGGFGGKDVGVTDTNGEVEFAPRFVIGLVGVRVARRASAFVTQCSHILVFGTFGWAYTERWGPIVGIEADLPPGYWLPASWPLAQTSNDDMIGANIGYGPHRYISFHNVDPLHPTAYLSGDATGFMGDTRTVFRIRSASQRETSFIDANRSRQYSLEFMRRSK